MGLLEPSNGRILIDGFDLHDRIILSGCWLGEQQLPICLKYIFS